MRNGGRAGMATPRFGIQALNETPSRLLAATAQFAKGQNKTHAGSKAAKSGQLRLLVFVTLRALCFKRGEIGSLLTPAQ